MSQDMESVLRNSLDAVDRGRRWAVVGVAALFVATAFALFALFHTAAGAPGEPGDLSLKAFYVATVTQMLFALCCAAAVMIHVTRMTKSILRAMELGKSK